MRALVVAGVAALAVIPAVPAPSKPKPVKVQVGDDYFGPTKLKVKKGTTVVWKWLDTNGNTHDVKLKKGPKGVKRFHSDLASTFYSYKRKLKVKGRYSIICTLHEGMTMTIRVR